MTRLGQDGLRADEEALPSENGLNTVIVWSLAPVDQRDQASGVEKKLTGHA